MNSEIWKKINLNKGNHTYLISSKGKLKNTKTNRINKGNLIGGYRRYSLIIDGKNKAQYAHILVAQTFLNNYHQKPIVDHRNGKRDDNRIENLRWYTFKENANNITTVKHKKRNKCIIMLDKDDMFIRYFNSVDICKNKLYIQDINLEGTTDVKGVKIKLRECKNIKQLKGEIWKDLKVDSTTMKVSNYGRIFVKMWPTFGTTNSFGYKKIKIGNSTKKVHRLVCWAFTGKNHPTLHIDHIDGNPLNNRSSNLEYVSCQKNNRRAHSKSIHKICPVTNEILKTYKSISSAALDIKRSNTSLCRCLKGLTKHCAGFKWNYVK